MMKIMPLPPSLSKFAKEDREDVVEIVTSETETWLK